MNFTNILENNSVASLNNTTLIIPRYTIIVWSILYVVLFVGGCFGNALVIFVVIRNKFLQHNTNYCLVNLSIADLLLLIVCMPVAFSDLFTEEIWYFGYVMCKIINWLEQSFVNASVLTMSSICVERYLAISNPLIVKKFTKKLLTIVIISIWILSIVFASPFVWFTKYLEGFHRKYNKHVYACLADFEAEIKRAYLFISLFGFYVLPCLLLIVQYGRIINIIRKMNDYRVTMMSSGSEIELATSAETNKFVSGSTRNQQNCHTVTNEEILDLEENNTVNKQLNNNNNNMSQNNANNGNLTPNKTTKLKSFKQKHDKYNNASPTVTICFKNFSLSNLKTNQQNKLHRQTIKMLMVMIVVFFVCILPYRIFSIWAVYATRDDFNKLGIYNHFNLLCLCRIMFYTNSAINPILYHILSSKFQNAFKRTVYQCFTSSKSKRSNILILSRPNKTK